MALAMPPPASPTGLGSSVKKLQLRPLEPLGADVDEDAGERHDGERASQPTQAPRAQRGRSSLRRRELRSSVTASRAAAPGSRADAPDQEPRDDVEHQR